MSIKTAIPWQHCLISQFVLSTNLETESHTSIYSRLYAFETLRHNTRAHAKREPKCINQNYGYC